MGSSGKRLGYDYILTSSCIEAGNLDVFSNEPLPNGDRINIGYYGNTTQASKSDISLVSPVTITILPDQAVNCTPPHCLDKNWGVFRWICHRVNCCWHGEGARRATGGPAAAPYTSAGVR